MIPPRRAAAGTNLNNQIEQDHHFIKRLVNPGMGFGSFNTARRTLRGAAMNMIRELQVQASGDILGRVEYARRKFLELLHNRSDSYGSSVLNKFLQHNPYKSG